MTNFLSNLDEIDASVKKGEITGFTDFPLEGEAFLFHAELKVNGGQNFLSFHLALSNNPTQRKVFDVRCPLPTDKDAARYLGLQRIYATLFGATRKDPKLDKVSVVFEGLCKFLPSSSIKVRFKLEERETFSARTGKTYKNQDIVSMGFIELAPRIEPTKKEEKPQAQTSSASSWSSVTPNEDSFF